MLTLIHRAIKDSSTYATVVGRPVFTDPAEIAAETVEVAAMLNLYITSEEEQQAIRDAISNPEHGAEVKEHARHLADLTKSVPVADDKTIVDRIKAVSEFVKLKGGQLEDFDHKLESIVELGEGGGISPKSIDNLLSLFSPEASKQYFTEQKAKFNGVGIIRAMLACSVILDIDDIMFSIANTMSIGVQAGVMEKISEQEFTELNKAVKQDITRDVAGMMAFIFSGKAEMNTEIIEIFKPHFVDVK